MAKDRSRKKRQTCPLSDVGVSKKSVSWTSKFVTMVLRENGRRSDVTIMVQTFWTPPCRVLPKTGNQKGNFVEVTMGRRREILFDLFD